MAEGEAGDSSSVRLKWFGDPLHEPAPANQQCRRPRGGAFASARSTALLDYLPTASLLTIDGPLLTPIGALWGLLNVLRTTLLGSRVVFTLAVLVSAAPAVSKNGDHWRQASADDRGDQSYQDIRAHGRPPKGPRGQPVYRTGHRRV